MLIVDAIGPFFRHYQKKRINWSKIPFASLENESGLKPEVLQTVPEDFARFVERVKAMGYTAITLDDLAHLVTCSWYPARLNQKIEAYQRLFRGLFSIAKQSGLQVFVTTDIMFFNKELDRNLGQSSQRVFEWLAQQMGELLRGFPEVDGIITRFGESDGVDVSGDFQSRLLLRRPSHVRKFLATVLPIFEDLGKKLIFRTWSVGAYQVGDLIWNPRTFSKVFDRVDSEALIISMKYGETDFFRYLPTNPLFFVSDHKKIVEFQARREYEGFGAYPSFVGWDCESHLQELKSARNVVGMSVWCQTGGWGKRRQLTLIRNSSPWVELNMYVMAHLYHGDSCQRAIRSFADEHLPNADAIDLLQFLELADDVIKQLLYVREFAERRIFFRRLRLPPQLFVFWDRIIVNHTMKRLLGCLVNDSQRALEEGREGLSKMQKMLEIAKSKGLPTKGLHYQLATFEILAAAREYFFQPFDPKLADELVKLKSEYKNRFKRSYSVRLCFEPAPIRRPQLRWLMRLFFRHDARYRWLDQVITLRLLSWSYPLIKKFRFGVGPKFAEKQAMGIDALLK